MWKVLNMIIIFVSLYFGVASNYSEQILPTKLLLNYKEKGEAEFTQWEKDCEVAEAVKGTCKHYILQLLIDKKGPYTLSERQLVGRKCSNSNQLNELLSSGRLEGMLLGIFIQNTSAVPQFGFASLVKDSSEVQLCIHYPVKRTSMLYESKSNVDPSLFPLATVMGDRIIRACQCRELSTAFKCFIDCPTTFTIENAERNTSNFKKTNLVLMVIGFLLLICYCCKLNIKCHTVRSVSTEDHLLPLLREPVSPIEVINNKNFKCGKAIGKGAFAHMYMTDYCRKPAAFEVFRREMKHFGKTEKLPCPMVLEEDERKCVEERPDLFVQYMVAVHEKEWLHGIVLELVYGKLDEKVIQKHSLNYGAKETCNWSLQIAQGLKFLHDKGLVHRNIKPTIYNHGKPKYRATEVFAQYFQFEDLCYSFASDIFSLGIIMWDIVHHGKHESERFHSVQNLSIRPSIEKDLNVADLGRLIVRCWHPDPIERPLIQELVD